MGDGFADLTARTPTLSDEAPDAPPERAPKHVLVVDDDDAIRRVVAETLLLEGYDVTAVSHGGVALDSLAQRLPDVILLDMRMPVMDGWEFARRYRATPGPHALIIVMTAAQDAPQWCREIGADGCLSKPFDLDDLLKSVEQPAHQHPVELMHHSNKHHAA